MKIVFDKEKQQSPLAGLDFFLLLFKSNILHGAKLPINDRNHGNLEPIRLDGTNFTHQKDPTLDVDIS